MGNGITLPQDGGHSAMIAKEDCLIAGDRGVAKPGREAELALGVERKP
jgi:hypothetical protein